jgi:2,3-bisphosphoglycerate-dependent phosphoglycerate mutase
MNRVLVLLRHGQSEWNLKNLFTGWKDPNLTDIGVAEARAAGRCLKAHGMIFDRAFSSNLIRARRTLQLALAELGQPGMEILSDRALNERDYGVLCGLNKDDAIRRWGSEQVDLWRRYYCQKILPAVLNNQRVIVAAHGNSLRALVMVLDGLTPEIIPELELATGIPLVYRLKPDSLVATRELLDPKRFVA